MTDRIHLDNLTDDDLDRLYDERDQLAARLARIAQAHHKNQAPGGMTSGDCEECPWAWPCPTYTWATTTREVTDTWDPDDNEADE